MEQELVSGTIAAVVFENPENGYAVIKLDSDDGGLITVVGTIPAPAAGERLIVTGKWTAHATYGRQLEASSPRARTALFRICRLMDQSMEYSTAT